MAGGTFDKQVGKDRPGTYINFQSGKHDTVGGSDRGIVIIPLKNHNYGPKGEFITLTAAAPDAAYAKLGYSIYDSDDNRQMLLIREAFKKAATVIVYRVNGGTEAKVTAAPVTAKAKYPGTRGNQFSFTVSENPVEGFDVQVNLAGSKVAEYTGLKTVEELVAQDCEYITFSGTGALVKNAGANLTGGTDVTMQNADVTALLDASEGVKFNCMCFPFTEAALQAAAKTKIKYIRENIGKGVQIAMPNTASGDYEGVINVTNGVTVDGVDLTAEEACAWVAAATAAANGGDPSRRTTRRFSSSTSTLSAATRTAIRSLSEKVRSRTTFPILQAFRRRTSRHGRISPTCCTRSRNAVPGRLHTMRRWPDFRTAGRRSALSGRATT